MAFNEIKNGTLLIDLETKRNLEVLSLPESMADDGKARVQNTDTQKVTRIHLWTLSNPDKFRVVNPSTDLAGFKVNDSVVLTDLKPGDRGYGETFIVRSLRPPKELQLRDKNGMLLDVELSRVGIF